MMKNNSQKLGHNKIFNLTMSNIILVVVSSEGNNLH